MRGANQGENMSTISHITEGETCAICGKPMPAGARTSFVLYWTGKKAGVWHPKCGPLPAIPGLTVRAGKAHDAA